MGGWKEGWVDGRMVSPHSLSTPYSSTHLQPSLVEPQDQVGDGLVHVDAQPLPERRRQTGARAEQLDEASPGLGEGEGQLGLGFGLGLGLGFGLGLG